MLKDTASPGLDSFATCPVLRKRLSPSGLWLVLPFRSCIHESGIRIHDGHRLWCPSLCCPSSTANTVLHPCKHQSGALRSCLLFSLLSLRRKSLQVLGLRGSSPQTTLSHIPLVDQKEGPHSEAHGGSLTASRPYGCPHTPLPSISAPPTS